MNLQLNLDLLRQPILSYNPFIYFFRRPGSLPLIGVQVVVGIPGHSQSSRETSAFQRVLGLAQGPPAARTWPEHLPREAARRHPDQIQVLCG